MAKRKEKQVEEVQPEPVEVVELVVEPVVDPVHEKAELIRSLSNDLDVLGEPFDPDNEDHAIIAAWLVGKNGLLRR